jgi:kynurenine formamidase
MEISRRIVTQLPLDELWTDTHVLDSRRTRYLEQQEIRALLQAGPVQFVIADVGDKLHWIEQDRAYAFWKNEAKEHINSEQRAYLDDYPGEYCYFASEWLDSTGARIVLLEKHH